MLRRQAPQSRVSMADWATIASLATAGTTLVLAFATFASVRSGNRTARAAERSLQISLRPLLTPSRLEDPAQKVGFADSHWVHVLGSGAIAEVTDEAIYLVMSLRNSGNGIAVLHGWSFTPDPQMGIPDHTDVAAFRRLTRDIYIPANELGFWQGAFRDPADPGVHRCARRNPGAASNLDRAAVRRSRGGPADDQSLRPHASRRRRVAPLGLAPLERRPSGAPVATPRRTSAGRGWRRTRPCSRRVPLRGPRGLRWAARPGRR